MATLSYNVSYPGVERPPAPLPDEGASTAEVQEQEEQTLNIIMEDSAEAVTLPEFDTGSRRSSTARPDRPDNLTTREYQFCFNQL